MAVRANALGGIHLHELFKMSTSTSGTIYQKAEHALESIKRKPVLYHVLLTMDVLFIDEAGQVSSEKLAQLDIILRKGRMSQTPFGGVLMIGTIDPKQLQPIQENLFSHLLSC